MERASKTQKDKQKTQTTDEERACRMQKDKHKTQTTDKEVGFFASELPETVAPMEILSEKNWLTLTF